MYLKHKLRNPRPPPPTGGQSYCALYLSIYPSTKEDDIYLKFGHFCVETDGQLVAE